MYEVSTRFKAAVTSGVESAILDDERSFLARPAGHVAFGSGIIASPAPPEDRFLRGPASELMPAPLDSASIEILTWWQVKGRYAP